MAVSVRGVRVVKRYLKDLQKRHRTLRPFLAVEGTQLIGMVKESWAQRRSPFGEKWKPYDDPERTGGRLRGLAQVRVRPKTLVFSGTYIARFHWFGTAFLPSRNPAPFVPLSELKEGRSGEVRSDFRSAGYIIEEEWARGHQRRLKSYILGRQLRGR